MDPRSFPAANRYQRLVIAFTLSCCVSPTVAADNAVRPHRPNIVLINADDLGFGDLGCYGNRETIAPNIDRLAKEGVRCTQFYVTWPACTPSRASLLTGRYPQRHGLYDMIRNDMVNYGHKYTEAEYALSPEMTLGLDERETTIAEVLKGAGYTCGVVGKWDSGRARRYLPLQRGFDFFYGFANTGIDYYTHQRYGIESMFRGNSRIEEEGYATDLFGREAVRFVRESRGRPFFLYVPFNAPHAASNLEKDSYQAPAETLTLYPNRDPKDKLTKFYAMVTRMDEQVGLIRKALEETGAIDNTLIVFTSDNGGSGNVHNVPLRGQKSTMFEGGLRVPMIAWWPGKLPANRLSDALLSTLEILPTFAKAAGAKLPDGVKLDGFDMLPVLAGGEKSSRTKMFWERRGDRAARVGDLKWVSSEKGSGLFDLSVDAGEKYDLTAERPELARQLETEFAAWRKEMDAAEPRGPFRDY
ncbi:MAG: N-acetylgalactosamine-6-sulfatase [Pirellula sp.]|nr:N-acetylgalactosamine-6-sulfatase [Pirellula sp.]